MAVRISFGPSTPNPPGSAFPVSHDAIVVDGTLAEIAHELATAVGSWPQLQRHWAGEKHPVCVNPALIRYVAEVPDE